MPLKPARGGLFAKARLLTFFLYCTIVCTFLVVIPVRDMGMNCSIKIPCIFFAVSLPSHAAQQNIGATDAVKNDVSNELAGTTGKLNTGDPVFRNEIVKTGKESTAKLVFLDSTNLAVGPISRVVLDRFVYEAPVFSALIASSRSGRRRPACGRS